MFRLVTQGCEKPTFLMICDNIECAVTTSAEAITSELNPVPVPHQEAAFLEQCKRTGWHISMRLSLCPGHHKQMLEMMDKRRSRIVGAPAPGPSPEPPAGPQGGAAFLAE